MSTEIEWLPPWSPFQTSERGQFEDELRRELLLGHDLLGVPIIALGGCEGSAQVAFVLDDGTGRVAVVDLTWDGRGTDPKWPAFTLYKGVPDWVERCLRPANRSFEAEKTFWIALMFRVTTEFAGMPDDRLREYRCDDLSPRSYHVEENEPRICGVATIIDHRDSWDDWEFTLFLDEPVGSRSEIDWSSLFPPENRTRWMALDPVSKQIQFEPSVAVPRPD